MQLYSQPMRTNFMTFFSLNHNLKTTSEVTLSAVTDIRPSLWFEWVPRNSHINLNFLIGIVGSGAQWKAFGFGVRTGGKGCTVSMIVGSCSHATRSFTFRSGFCEDRGSRDPSSTRACLLFHTHPPALPLSATSWRSVRPSLETPTLDHPVL